MDEFVSEDLGTPTFVKAGDNDCIPNYMDEDSDDDGIPDKIEGIVDTDGDGIPNFIDIDSDNDCKNDQEEGLTDANENGIPDYIDADISQDCYLELITVNPIDPDKKDPIKPIVDIVFPSNDEVFLVGEDIVITANGSDEDGEIVRYSFFYDGTKLIQTVTGGSNSIVTSFSEPGRYRLNVRAADNDGQVTISAPIFINVEESITATQDLIVSQGIQVFPNPSIQGVFHLNDSKRYSIYDVNNQLIKEAKGDLIDISSYSKGVYFLQIGADQIKLVY